MGISGAVEVKRRKRKTNTIAVVAVALAAVCLGGILAVMANNAKERGRLRSRDAEKTAAEEAQEKAKKVIKPVYIEGLDVLEELQDSKPQESVSTAAVPVADLPEESDWTDARSGAVSRGPIQVKIDAVELGPVRFVRGTEECLTVRLELRNNHETKVFTYRTWGLLPGVSLVDDHDNRYALRSFRLQSAAINPGRAVEELLVFQKPVAEAKLLRLQLPAIAFDEIGMVRFEIPASMINRVEEPLPRGEDSSPAKPDKVVAEEPAATPPDDISKLNADIEALGGGDRVDEVEDFESDPELMRAFEELRQEQQAKQEAARKSKRRTRRP